VQRHCTPGHVRRPENASTSAGIRRLLHGMIGVSPPGDCRAARPTTSAFHTRIEGSPPCNVLSPDFCSFLEASRRRAPCRCPRLGRPPRRRPSRR
jgi:hypothetical protein